MYGNKLVITMGVVIGLMFSNSIAYAKDPQFGVKIGQMMVDVGGLDDATNVGFVVGIPLDKNNLSIEVELTTTIIEGDAFFSSEWDITTLAGYAVYRSNSPTYVKLKGGLLYEDVSVSSFSDTDTGLSLGAGVGWNLESNNKLELEVTIVEEDVVFLSLGYLF